MMLMMMLMMIGGPLCLKNIFFRNVQQLHVNYNQTGHNSPSPDPESENNENIASEVMWQKSERKLS